MFWPPADPQLSGLIPIPDECCGFWWTLSELQVISSLSDDDMETIGIEKWRMDSHNFFAHDIRIVRQKVERGKKRFFGFQVKCFFGEFSNPLVEG